MRRIQTLLDDLAELDSKGPNVLSLYMVTNPSTANGRKLDVEFKEATRLPREGSGGKDAQLKRDLDIAWEALTNLLPPPRSVAVFSSAGRNFFRLLELPLELPVRAAWGPSPSVRPLLEALDQHRHTLLMFVDKQHAKLFHVVLGSVDKIQDWRDDSIPGKHDQAGQEESKFQRHREAHVRWHVKRAADGLMRIAEAERIPRIVVSGPEETVQEFRRQLPDATASKVLLAQLPINAFSSPADILKASHGLLNDLEHQEEQRVLAQLQELRGRGHAVFGLADVLEAVLEQRAALLVYTPRAQFAGARCRACGLLAPSRGTGACPACGAPLAAEADLLERLIERVRKQGGRIEALRGQPAEALDKQGAIAAMLRYSL